MILVADQKRMVADLLARRLEAMGWATAVTTDASGALKRLVQGNIDLAIIDPALDGSGLDVLLKLRANRATAKIPVILFGAGDSPQEREAASRAGADAFMVKGRVSPNQVLARVTELVGAPVPLAAMGPEVETASSSGCADYAILIQPELGDARRLARSVGLRSDLHCSDCGRPAVLRLSIDHAASAWTLGCPSCAASVSGGSSFHIEPVAGALP